MKDKKEALQEIEVLELLNKELPVRYPKGSMVVFTAQRTAGKEESEYEGVFNCNWYNKKGGIKHAEATVSKPPEWQSLTFKEVESICQMFDSCMVINRSVIIAHDYCQKQTGINTSGEKGTEELKISN